MLCPLVLLGCGSDGEDAEAQPAAEETAVAEATEEAPVEAEATDEVPAEDEEVQSTADQPGENEGVLILAEPVEWSSDGYTMVVDAIRILGVESVADELGSAEVTDLLSDPQAQSLVGLRVTLRNETDAPAEWFVGGFDTAIVIDGQQGSPFLLGDSGDTIRAGAEAQFNPYYESRLSLEDARAAGEFTWDPGDPVNPDTFATIAEVPDQTISYAFP